MSKVKKLVFGVGFNDADYVQQIFETVGYVDGKQKQQLIWKCPYYRSWMSMLQRGYSAKYKSDHPTYQDVTVCREWLTFSKFKSWMEQQDWEGKQLDKDILIEGNKVYSPETCVFVSKRVNTFIVERQNDRGEYPIGVFLHNRDNVFIANISNLKGKQVKAGRYKTPQEAHLAWAQAKRQLLEQLIVEENLEPRIVNALRDKYDRILINAKSGLNIKS